MTETTQTPFSGLMVKARKMPDLMYPRWEKWYNTSTYISTRTTSYKGHAAQAGRNFVSTIIADRKWHVNTPPARAANVHSTVCAMDITTPAYMLADTDGATAVTEDTLIGLDYANVPIRMYKDIDALERHSNTNLQNGGTLFGRVLAIKHQLTFSNFSRFPLEVYWAILPVGHLWPSPTGSFEPHVDIMAQTYSKVVVPAVRDANDRSKKRTIDIDVNLKRLWPNEYDIMPGTNMSGVDAASSTLEGNSPWFGLHQSTTSATIRNFPAGQLADDSKSTPDLSTNGPTCGLRLQWFCKLQNPHNLGQTTEAAGDGGDYSGNNYDVHANMGWLLDMMRVGQQPIVHLGEKAYPSTAA